MNHAAWVSSSDRALTMAASQIRLIQAVTPANADGELADLVQAFGRGRARLPRWRYEPMAVRPELRRALEGMASLLDKEPPLGPIYAARARELCLEAALIDATGTPRLTSIARERFLPASAGAEDDARRADDLAASWTSAHADEARPGDDDDAAVTREHPAANGKHRPPGPIRRAEGPREAPVRSCDARDPRSLFSRLASEVGRKRLPMRVCTQPGMASLAATGDGVILVAANKWLSGRDVERTVLHEIEGHALPRARAARAPIALFAFGTARGIDDQEGRAIALEQEAGFLDSARKFELGCRHIAARAALEGADFTEIVGILRARGAAVETALRIAARVQRGSHGVGGLAREVVYLTSRCKIERLLRGPDGPKIERVMRGGRVAADVALDLAAALSQK